VSLIELPRRRASPRVFIEPAPGLRRRLTRALNALGDLELELPGLDALSDALISLADELEGDANFEPEDDCEGEEEGLPLFAFAERRQPTQNELGDYRSI
jgi:hypothetical protein